MGAVVDEAETAVAAAVADTEAAVAAAARRIAYAVSKNRRLVSARDARLSAKAMRTRSEESDARRCEEATMKFG